MRILGFESSESGGKTPLRSLRSSSMRTGMFPRQSLRVYSQLTVSFPYSWTVSQAVLLSPVTRTVYRRLDYW